jgi:hypothetical protein
MFTLETVITYSMVPLEFVPEGKTVNSEFCVQMLERVLKQMFMVRPQFQEMSFLILL